MTRPELRLLDRYLGREFGKIFVATALGFPVLTILIDLTDHLDRYLARNLSWSSISLGYLFGVPEKVFFILPAAVLFATVFSVGALSRHSEVTAAKASGVSFQRLVLPLFGLALLVSLAGFLLGELTPAANHRRAVLLGETRFRSRAARENFVYLADGGRIYAVRSLSVSDREMRDVQVEREGAGPEFPGYFATADRGTYDSLAGWTLVRGSLRLFLGPDREVAFGFDSLRQKAMTERPSDLVAEPKGPDEMRYAELGRYVRTLERSGGDANKLKVERSLKLAIPFTCLVIALFGAPLALTGPKGGAAYGVGVSLATTMVFLTLVQFTKAIGAGGVVPPALAAWLPNAIFGLAGATLFLRART